MLKKIGFAVAAALISSLAHANSPYDGAYACTGYVPALNFGFYSYVVFLTKADGVTAATSVLSPVPTAFQTYGYSYGTLNGNVYTGTDPLSGKTSSITFTASGTAPVNGQILINGTPYADTATCAKVF